MKKLLLLMMALVLGWGLKAQTNLTQAVDFTATDVHGTEIHLFDILDSGQAVLIDFFYTTCGACIQSIPYMTQAYQALGCNMHDVYFVEIDFGDSEAACLNWVNNHSVEYPTIAGVSGGTGICSQYGISFFPTVILILPDHSIVIQDLYPIPNAQTVINQLGNHGIEQHDCSVVYEETLTFSTDTINVDWMELTWITVYNNTAQDAVVDTIISYFLCYTLDGTNFFSTLRPMEFTIPQGESIELGLYCDAVSKDVFWDVVTLAGNLPDASFVAGVDLPWSWSVEENADSFTVFPNPANESVTIKGTICGTVNVFNALGQQVESIEASGNELNINTSSYLNGVYFIKANETTMRFVVSH